MRHDLPASALKSYSDKLVLDMPDQHHVLYLSIQLDYTDPQGLAAPILPNIIRLLQVCLMDLHRYLKELSQETTETPGRPLLADLEQCTDMIESVFEGTLAGDPSISWPDGCRLQRVKVVNVLRLPKDLHHAMAVQSDPSAWPTMQ